MNEKEKESGSSSMNSAPADKPVRPVEQREAIQWARKVAECEAETGLD